MGGHGAGGKGEREVALRQDRGRAPGQGDRSTLHKVQLRLSGASGRGAQGRRQPLAAVQTDWSLGRIRAAQEGNARPPPWTQVRPVS